MPIAVAALPAIILALVGMVILWGLALLLKSVLQALAHHIPGVGGALAGAIGSVIDEAITLGTAAASSVLHDAVGIILAPVYWVERHITGVINLFHSIISSISYITRSLIPSVIASLETAITTAYHNAIGYVQATAHLIYATLTYDITVLEHAMTAADTMIEHYAEALATAAENYTTAAIAAESAYVRQIAGALETEITTVAGAESAYARALYTDSITYAQSLVTAAETALATDLTHVVDWTQTQVTALDAAIAAMGTQVIALTVDAVGTVEADLRNLKTECTDNLCSGLSGLAHLFNSLVDTAAIAALVGYAAWMGTEPRAAGHATADVLAPIAGAAAGAARDVIGAL